VILGFIGIKLIDEALTSEGVSDIGPVHLPEIGILASLAFIAGTLLLTTIASLARARLRSTT
jgi:tellurite resistance protein TerC